MVQLLRLLPDDALALFHFGYCESPRSGYLAATSGGGVGKAAKGAKITRAKVARVRVANIAGAQVANADADTPFDPQAFLTRASAGITISTYRASQTVFAQGDIAAAVFYVQTGRLKAVVRSKQGREVVVGIRRAGQFFGEGCLNGDALRNATISATEDSVITAIAKTTMIAALRGHPKLSGMFMSYLLTRNNRIEQDLIDQLFNSSEKRLARLLLLLANFGLESSPQPIDAKINQETLAEMIGTTRSRVSFFMNKFHELGFISYHGNIEVNSSLLNAVLSDRPQVMEDD
jgi:CRP/FNR family cyclic AMP-dependent transcriptional regulator